MSFPNRIAAALRARPVLASLTLLFAAWTFFWVYQAVLGVLADTSLGRGELEGGLAFHQVWEVSFVAAVYFIRWAGGAVLYFALAVGGTMMRRFRGPGRRRLATQS